MTEYEQGQFDILYRLSSLWYGKQYYFLDATDAKKFANGNRIASTALVEAIDPMYKASKVGVVDENGVEIIPCANRSIKQVPNHDDVLLVETAIPISKSVIEANELRSDPLSATRLVSTPSFIKEKITLIFSKFYNITIYSKI